MSVDPAPRRFQADLLTELFQDPLDPAYAQAAAARAARPPSPGWRRWSHRGMSTVALVVIGALLAVAYKQVVSRAPEREQARAALIGQIHEQTDNTDKMAESADKLQDEVTRLREAALSDTAIAQLRQLEAASGLRKVTGDGLVIKLADGPAAATEDLARILDYDLQNLANTLWSEGAEAISINGQRLTATTPIRRAGGAILVGNAWIRGPYEISAIGPGNMVDAFNNSLTADIFRKLRDDPQYKIGFDVDSRDGLQLPAGVLPKLQYAVVPSASPSPTASPSGGGK
jgi:uncharacterized protein YlxW (UPF0749 family)